MERWLYKYNIKPHLYNTKLLSLFPSYCVKSIESNVTLVIVCRIYLQFLSNNKIAIIIILQSKFENLFKLLLPHHKVVNARIHGRNSRVKNVPHPPARPRVLGRLSKVAQPQLHCLLSYVLPADEHKVRIRNCNKRACGWKRVCPPNYTAFSIRREGKRRGRGRAFSLRNVVSSRITSSVTICSLHLTPSIFHRSRGGLRRFTMETAPYHEERL